MAFYLPVETNIDTKTSEWQKIYKNFTFSGLKMTPLRTNLSFLLMFFVLYIAFSKPLYAQTKVSIVAVVDGMAISSVDLENKIRLLLLTTGKSGNSENLEQHREEALEMLIDETLKIQAGRSLNPDSLAQATTTARSFFEDIYGDQVLSGADRLQAAGIQVSTAHDQIKADIVWTRVLTQKFQRQFSQVDMLANAEKERILADLSAPQYKISEIVLMPLPSRPQKETYELADQLGKAIRKGADFNAVAAQYSMSGSAKNGGNIGWVQAKKLPSDVRQALDDGRLAEDNIILVNSEDFSYVFRLEGFRELGFNDPALDRISMARAVLSLPSNISVEARDEQISKLKTETEKINNCNDLNKYHDSLGSKVGGQINNVVIEKLEKSFRKLVLRLSIGKTSKIIQTGDN